MTAPRRVNGSAPPLGLARPHVENPQETLFDVEPDWRTEWWGMPSFEQRDARPLYRISVSFHTLDDLLEFARVTGLRVTPRTDSAIFPQQTLDAPRDWEYADEP